MVDARKIVFRIDSARCLYSYLNVVLPNLKLTPPNVALPISSLNTPVRATFGQIDWISVL
jgi:hypothetical protein